MGEESVMIRNNSPIDRQGKMPGDRVLFLVCSKFDCDQLMSRFINEF
jgi:hypothetical protein